MLQIVDQVVL